MSDRAIRTKRTYNLSESTVRRVRELAEQYGAAKTQDGVVEIAVERLYHEARDRAEGEQWAAAARDLSPRKRQYRSLRDVRAISFPIRW